MLTTLHPQSASIPKFGKLSSAQMQQVEEKLGTEYLESYYLENKPQDIKKALQERIGEVLGNAALEGKESLKEGKGTVGYLNTLLKLEEASAEASQKNRIEKLENTLFLQIKGRQKTFRAARRFGFPSRLCNTIKEMNLKTVIRIMMDTPYYQPSETLFSKIIALLPSQKPEIGSTTINQWLG